MSGKWKTPNAKEQTIIAWNFAATPSFSKSKALAKENLQGKSLRLTHLVYYYLGFVIVSNNE